MRHPGAVTDAETWKKSLDKYRYPVDLRKFRSGTEHRGWFESNISPGDPRQTRDFEARFRKLAPYHLEAWAEVAFWKLYSRRGIARKNALKVLRSGISPRTLWCSCNDYIEDPSIESFRGFGRLLFDTPVVATAATIPAFICPEKFPMVDTQVTKWAGNNGHLHTYAAIGGPDLEEVPVLKTGPVLRESHWAFIKSWISWCQFGACILRQRTRYAWRARDVEMAVFTAQRCGMPLNPLA